MTTNSVEKKKTRHPLRIAAVTAATVALLTVGASAAANPEFLSGITMQISSVFQVGELRQDLTTDTGETVTALEIPNAQVENRDGQAVLVVMDEEIDITDALERDGQYEYTYEDEGTQLTILVEGAPEKWTMTTRVTVPSQEGGISLVTTSEEQETAESISGGAAQSSGDSTGQPAVGITAYGGRGTETLYTTE